MEGLTFIFQARLYRRIMYSLLFLWCSGTVSAQVQLSNIRCEMRENPQGIDMLKPNLSWLISGNERAIAQEYFQILVASTAGKLAAGEADLWDSGKLKSTASTNVTYDGKALKSRQKCFWKVKVWTNKGESNWSAPAYWSVGLLHIKDWKGRWIGMDRAAKGDVETQFSRLSARYFRKEFTTQKELKSATAYIIGLGLYELYMNGQKVGDQVLAPGPTDYNVGVKYNTFDVTSLLKKGNNAIGTILGNGRFYTMRQAFKPYKIKTFGYPKMRLNLELEYTDGSRETISTDDTWKMTASGPIRANNEYDGEEYDATMEMPGWNISGYNAQAWQKAEYVQEAPGMPEAQMNENMKVMETIAPVSIKWLKPDVYILDMGQNMAGWIKMSVMGKAGQQVKLRFAETLQDNGELFVKNLRDAKVTDKYTLKGGAKESWEPTFVYHGFRYVEVTGYPGKPALKNFEGCVVYDDMKTTGTFHTSNPTINAIHQNAYWGIRGNYKGMPVDCPQRNERQPWLGDRTTGAYGESFLFDNGRLYTKWLDDIQQAQKADGSIPDVVPAYWRYFSDNMTWPGTYLTIAEMIYQQFGDLRPIVKHYPSMKKWLSYMQSRYVSDGLMTKDEYGDWCVPPEAKEMIFSKDPARQTDGELIASATYYKMLNLMQDFAARQHLDADVAAYKLLAERLKMAFNEKFLDKVKLSYGNNTVTANLLPLSFGMVKDTDKEKVFKNITDKIAENGGHISTGVIGTQYLMRGVSAYGRPDLAYQLTTTRTYPGWGYMVENGATTIWELWNGNTADPGMNSQNHVMLLGDLMIWYYENVGGIKAASPGFKTIVMKPEIIAGLTAAEASHESVHGLISSQWAWKKKHFVWNITIPANTKAKIYIPASAVAQVLESGKKITAVQGVQFIEMEGNRAVLEIGSGTYKFESLGK